MSLSYHKYTDDIESIIWGKEKKRKKRKLYCGISYLIKIIYLQLVFGTEGGKKRELWHLTQIKVFPWLQLSSPCTLKMQGPEMTDTPT